MADKRALPLERLPLRPGAGAALWLAGPALQGRVPDLLWTCLSRGEKEKASRIRRAEERMLFAVARGALRVLLGEATGVAAARISFAQGPFGKPFVAGPGGPHFNVSHSGAFALIGLSERRPIGVDIERLRAAGGEADLARSFFSNSEYRALEGLEGDALLRCFYRLWTAKEAILKACGVGIPEHLKEFSVEATRDGYAIHPEPGGRLPELAAAVVEPAGVPPGYAGCYALA